MKNILRHIIIFILATLGGILGNLISAIIENTVNLAPTTVSMLGLVGGVVIVGVLGYSFEFPSRKQLEITRNKALENEIIKHRIELFKLKQYHLGGASSTEEISRLWVEHQANIRDKLRLLTEKRIFVPTDPIDTEPPPPLGRLSKIRNEIKGCLGYSVLPILIGLAIVSSFQLSPLAHILYTEFIDNNGLPYIEPSFRTKTPSIPALSPTPTFTYTPTATPSFTPSPTPPTPTITPTITSTSTPPTPSITPTITSTSTPPTPSITPTITSTSTPPTQTITPTHTPISTSPIPTAPAATPTSPSPTPNAPAATPTSPSPTPNAPTRTPSPTSPIPSNTPTPTN